MKLELMDCPFCGEEVGVPFTRTGNREHPVEPTVVCHFCKKTCDIEYECVPQGDSSGMAWILERPGDHQY